jgi:hypothetical protein
LERELEIDGLTDGLREGLFELEMLGLGLGDFEDDIDGLGLGLLLELMDGLLLNDGLILELMDDDMDGERLWETTVIPPLSNVSMAANLSSTSEFQLIEQVY